MRWCKETPRVQEKEREINETRQQQTEAQNAKTTADTRVANTQKGIDTYLKQINDLNAKVETQQSEIRFPPFQRSYHYGNRLLIP